ncbi:MAG: di-heme oxidoredictase family protein [Planctomycetaceae bacterium]
MRFLNAVCLCAMLAASAHAGDVERGSHFFSRNWTAKEGLGPRSNAKSCVACHFEAGPGGAGDNTANVDVLTLVKSTNHAFWIDAGFAGQRSAVLHVRSEKVEYMKQRFDLLGIKRPKGAPCDELVEASKAVTQMRKAEQRLRRRGPLATIRVHGAELELASRNTPPLFGLGEVDKIPFAVIRENGLAMQKKFPWISGRMAGRFGWRGQMRTLQQFVKAACDNELGLRHEDVPEVLTTHIAIRRTWDVDESLTDFIAALPRPRRVLPANQFQRNMIQNGESIFTSIGCTACHVKDLGEVEGLYSDLLLHDMGRALADSAAAPEAMPDGPTPPAYYGGGSLNGPLTPIPQLAKQEWKTPPLWGVAVSAPYLHDGRAPTLHDAIMMHGGEASTSVIQYQRLDVASRRRVLAFLMTLQGPDRKDLNAVTMR